MVNFIERGGEGSEGGTEEEGPREEGRKRRRKKDPTSPIRFAPFSFGDKNFIWRKISCWDFWECNEIFQTRFIFSKYHKMREIVKNPNVLQSVWLEGHFAWWFCPLSPPPINSVFPPPPSSLSSLFHLPPLSILLHPPPSPSLAPPPLLPCPHFNFLSLSKQKRKKISSDGKFFSFNKKKRKYCEAKRNSALISFDIEKNLGNSAFMFFATLILIGI